jgi:predicted SAM-dependent methyltransferase
MKQLLIGCGSLKNKRLSLDGSTQWEDLTTLDYNPDHRPDVVWDLMEFPLPFEDNTFDEIHAYEVLEHTGMQGDYKFFFAQFSELWRVLKPDGHILATCPSRHSAWAWGDPSHTRVLQREHLIFLSQEEYANQIGVTAMSDFRSIYKANFKTFWVQEDENAFMFIIKAIKENA